MDLSGKRLGWGALVSVLLLVLFFAFLFSYGEKVIDGIPPDSLPPAVALTVKSVYRLSVDNVCRGETISRGSAVVFGRKALTARHVFAPMITETNLAADSACYAVRLVHIPDGASEGLRVSALPVDMKVFKDAALLALSDSPSTIPASICFSNEYHTGDTIYIAGYPRASGHRLTVIRNVIAGIQGKNHPAYIFSKGGDLGGGGMSGGAVIDARGCEKYTLGGRSEE